MSPRRPTRGLWLMLAPLALVVAAALAFAAYRSCRATPEPRGFRVHPFLQNPAPDGVLVTWFSHRSGPGTLRHRTADEVDWTVHHSDGARALALADHRDAPYRHRVRITGLVPGRTYEYRVDQDDARYTGRFATAPERGPARLIATADCEAEPESTGKPAAWADPAQRALGRYYLVDQTDGFAGHLSVIRARAPGLLVIAGDLVESGGEQRDWDELWRHLTAADAARSAAGAIPVFAVPGNHEYYAGPRIGRYQTDASERAIARYDAYFAPSRAHDAAPAAPDGARYARLDYGPVAVIGLDATNGSPHRSDADTNFHLRGARDPGGGSSPGFALGTAQHAWLEAQLADAQRRAAFTFVVLHHGPYSSGPHGWPAGEGAGRDPQSGVPVRALIPLLMRYGVDLVLSGHGEIFERFEVSGRERVGDGERPHRLQIYDVGVCGDGLRSPEPGLVNPERRWIAHDDAPERWEDDRLVSGGKHYGHLEIDIAPTDAGWRAELVPVYVLPVMRDGEPARFDRREYEARVVLRSP